MCRNLLWRRDILSGFPCKLPVMHPEICELSIHFHLNPSMSTVKSVINYKHYKNTINYIFPLKKKVLSVYKNLVIIIGFYGI